jgi:predicted homoserine dehydrogenase-like protein
MNLHKLLLQRAAAGRPVRLGIVGCGKFATMFLAQAQRIPGLHIAGIADIAPGKAAEQLLRAGWQREHFDARSFGTAIDRGTTHLTDDAAALIAHPAIEVIAECTGNPIAATSHALAAFRHRKHVIMVTVEADAFVGPLLAQKAKEAGVIYSLGYGDQPALICDLVDWARSCGFSVVAAGRGHKWLPHYYKTTPDTVWSDWGLNEAEAREGGLNPRMFTCFLDGSKPAIETTAVANATGLEAPSAGLAFPACAIDDLPRLMRPREDGGILERKGLVECVSSVERDGRPIPHHIRWGVWVVMEAGNDYVKRCFKEYAMTTDPSGRYGVMYKWWHLIGLELGISVAAVAVRGEPTGCPITWNADAVAAAKRDLEPGELLDGEGGYTVAGKLMPAADSVARGAVPIGLAHKIKAVRPIREGQTVTWADVAADESVEAYKVRREMERLFAPGLARAAE